MVNLIGMIVIKGLQVLRLVPHWLKLFVPQSILKEKLQNWYDSIKDYLYDGVIGGISLEAYFRANNSIDHAVRVNVSEYKVSFYIHPAGANGDTLDFIVKGNSLRLK